MRVVADLFFEWWTWAIFALILLVLEVVAPFFLLLGFAIGAGIVAAALLLLGSGVFGGSAAITLVVFAAASLAAWIALRNIFKLRTGQVKNFDHDIND